MRMHKTGPREDKHIWHNAARADTRPPPPPPPVSLAPLQWAAAASRAAWGNGMDVCMYAAPGGHLAVL